MATDPSPNEFPPTVRPFAARLLTGEATTEDVPKVVRAYITDKEARRKGITLARWLGLTDEAYGAWVTADEAKAEADEGKK